MMIRPHFLTAGDALDRRRLQELFLWVANRINELPGTGIKSKQFTRSNFNINAFEEFQSDYDYQIQFVTPEMGYASPAAALDVQCDDGFFEGILDWSLKADIPGTGKMIMAVPFICGIPVFAGEDWIEIDQLIAYVDPAAQTKIIDPADDSLETSLLSFNSAYGISIGNSVGFTGLNGRGRAGIVVFSVGKFTVTAASISVRKVLR